MNLDELLMNLVVFNAFLGFTYICSRVLTVWVVDRYIYSLPCFPNHKTDFAGSVPVNVVTNRAKKAQFNPSTAPPALPSESLTGPSLPDSLRPVCLV